MILNSIDSFCRSKQLPWVGPLLLCAEEADRVPTAIPGVYVLHTFDATRGFYPALYVGKSRDLRARLIQHLESLSTSPDIIIVRGRVCTYFTAAPVIDPVERAGLEAGLIALLRPPCNRQVPRGRRLYPNLPPFTLRF